MQPSTVQQLFDNHLRWAESIARNIARKMPTAFDPEDLVQEARIEHWKRCKSYDPASGVPYEGYAFPAVRGAVLMACRRRGWKDAMHDELDLRQVDTRPLADAELIEAENAEIEAPKREIDLLAVSARMVRLSPVERYLVQSIYFDCTDVAEVARKWGSGSRPAIARRVMRAVGKLRSEEDSVKQTLCDACGEKVGEPFKAFGDMDSSTRFHLHRPDMDRKFDLCAGCTKWLEEILDKQEWRKTG